MGNYREISENMIVFQVLTFLCLPVYVKLQSYNEFDKVNNRRSKNIQISTMSIEESEKPLGNLQIRGKDQILKKN